MIDNNKYDYIPEKHPNIVFECQKGTLRQNLKVTLDSRISLLANILAARRPGWMLVCKGGFTSSATGNFCTLHVYEDHEEVGILSLNPRREGMPYRIDSSKSRKSKTRGAAPCTGDMKKAVNLCLQFFKPETLDEKIAKAEQGARTKLHTIFYKTRTDVNNSRGVITTHLELLAGEEGLDKILANASLLIDPNARENVSSYKDRVVADSMAVDMFDHYATNKGYHIIIQGPNYHVHSRTTKTTELFTTDNLDQEFKAAVGMLKLVKEGDYIPNIGVRVAEDMFFIIRSEYA